ncbi:MAG: hypothetical protein DMF12_06720 [Verrucomicrobia bacterium]|nr:MAG: hypothetical protein DMF12_06720 [Verrucomicrobiota bacterium]
MLDCQLYGLKAGGHHATNVILHTIAVLLLFRVLREMTGAVWKSTIVAALFAVHPLHVESVAWVSERKDVLSAVFFLLMLNAYVRYARAPSMTRYLLVAVLFAAGLMSKPMLVTAPVILLLLDYWPLRRFKQYSSTTGKVLNSGKQLRTRQRLFLEKIPLLLLSAGSCFVTFVLQKHATGAIPPLPFLWRVQNALVSYASRHHCVSDRFPKQTTLCVHWLVLVSRYASPSDWPRSGWRTRSCRPLYLPPAYRAVSARSLVGC